MTPSATPEPPSLTAAQEAAAFVARIFADEGADPHDVGDVGDVGDIGHAIHTTLASTSPAAPVPNHWASPLQGQAVLILGLGASGLAMVRWCVRCGAQVTVADTRTVPPQLHILQTQYPQVRFIAGAFDAALVDQSQGQSLYAIYRSPGLSATAIAPILSAAHACQIKVRGELDLYAQALEALHTQHGYAPAVLAITGTNGKTTVTSLTGQLVAHADKSVAVAGNIGPTLLDTLSARIDGHDLPQVWVLELSSFQLADAHDFSPTAATVLNLTQDHLDWHPDMADYAAAKACIFGHTTHRVLNREDGAVMAMLPASSYTTFGYDVPQRPGDLGIEWVNGMAWLVRAHDDEDLGRSRPRKASRSRAELHLQRLMPAEALRIRGQHNACNALAALALALAAGCSLSPMLYGLREYRGEPHRVEPLGRVNGVEYFDDSKGTNVGATVAALAGLGTQQRLVVILGGEGKGQDFSPLLAPIARYARAVILIGRDAARIEAALHTSGLPLQHASTMQQAVQYAAQHAQTGDAVLMSPACASLDMFRDYAHRAQVFIEAVRTLAHEHGQTLEDGL